ncbi:hypothetical protein QZH41_003887, partial [Actinostola sp. cb2023]
MELHNMDEVEQSQDAAVTEIRSRYVNPDTSKFISRMDEFEQVLIQLPRGNAKEWGERNKLDERHAVAHAWRRQMNYSLLIYQALLSHVSLACVALAVLEGE